MTPAQALSHLQKEFGAAYLLLGAEAYQRGRVKEAIVAAVLGTEGREYGLTQYSLAETPLAAVLDDARSLSLFAPERVIVVRDAKIGRASCRERV